MPDFPPSKRQRLHEPPNYNGQETLWKGQLGTTQQSGFIESTAPLLAPQLPFASGVSLDITPITAQNEQSHVQVPYGPWPGTEANPLLVPQPYYGQETSPLGFIPRGFMEFIPSQSLPFDAIGQQTLPAQNSTWEASAWAWNDSHTPINHTSMSLSYGQDRSLQLSDSRHYTCTIAGNELMSEQPDQQAAFQERGMPVDLITSEEGEAAKPSDSQMMIDTGAPQSEMICFGMVSKLCLLLESCDIKKTQSFSANRHPWFLP